jgi:hypothetical protein
LGYLNTNIRGFKAQKHSVSKKRHYVRF